MKKLKVIMLNLVLVIVQMLLVGDMATADEWPITASPPDFNITLPDDLSSTFGSRLQASESYIYDFHRGIDIPAPCNTPVRAIVAGAVRMSGDYESYEDRMVQIRHYKPGKTSCQNGGCYYSNYMHLTSTAVVVDEHVTEGQIVGYSGESGIEDSGVCYPDNVYPNSGFDHLHFEIRDGGIYQMYAVHPLLYLPYADATAPQIKINMIDVLNPFAPKVNVTVKLPDEGLDLNRVEVVTYDMSSGTLVEIDRKYFDMIEWNNLWTPIPQGNPNQYLDDPYFCGNTDIWQWGVFCGLYVEPDSFNASNDIYSIDFTFELNGTANVNDLYVTVKAVDIHGAYTEVSSPPTTDTGEPYAGIEGETITLDGSGSDGNITLYEWDVTNDGIYDYSSSSPTYNYTYEQQGTYTIKLRVTDNLGATDEATTTATISDTSPTADFTASSTSGTAPLTVNFTNNSSGYDQPLSYAWDFNNDEIVDSTAQNPSFVYISPGTYTVKLTITDFDGSINMLQRDAYITVAAPVYTLNINKTGTGSGRVASSPTGIDCGFDCSELYVEGTDVTLTATSDATSIFTGWSGGGCSETGNCVVTMNEYTTVTANFELKPIRIGTTYYTSLQAAYDAAGSGQTVESQGIMFEEGVSTGTDKYVVFQGGYNNNFTAITGITRLRGQFHSDNFGVVKLRNFRLEISQ